jgi:hypothetical protein
MAEFLLRGYNVAMPEVDIGDDIFVVHDREGELWRVQVKTAICKQARRERGTQAAGVPAPPAWRGKFAISRTQVRTSHPAQ